MEAIKVLPIPFVKVVDRLTIHGPEGATPRIRSDKIRRIGLERGVRIPRRLKFAKEQKQPCEGLLFVGCLLEVSHEVKAAVDHRPVMLGGGHQNNRLPAKKEILRLVRSKSNRI